VVPCPRCVGQTIGGSAIRARARVLRKLQRTPGKNSRRLMPGDGRAQRRCPRERDRTRPLALPDRSGRHHAQAVGEAGESRPDYCGAKLVFFDRWQPLRALWIGSEELEGCRSWGPGWRRTNRARPLPDRGRKWTGGNERCAATADHLRGAGPGSSTASCAVSALWADAILRSPRAVQTVTIRCRSSDGSVGSCQQAVRVTRPTCRPSLHAAQRRRVERRPTRRSCRSGVQDRWSGRFSDTEVAARLWVTPSVPPPSQVGTASWPVRVRRGSGRGADVEQRRPLGHVRTRPSSGREG